MQQAPAVNKLGVHLLLDDGRSHWPTSLWREHMQTASSIISPNGTVTQLVRLDDLDPAAYAQFLIDVSLAVKTADPQARILNAPSTHLRPRRPSR